MRYFLLISVLLIVPVTAVPASEPGIDAISLGIRKQITDADAITSHLVLNWNNIESFYTQRQFKPVWSNNGVLNTRAIQLRQTLHVADQEGLEPADYHLKAIEQLWQHPCYSDLASLDILLTDAFLRYALDVHKGRYSPDTDVQKWHIQAPQIDRLHILQQALRSNDFERFLHELPPPHLGYRQLREALTTLEQIAKRGGWAVVPAGPSLREGMQHPHVRIVRQRLLADGSLTISMAQDDAEYDQTLSFAVQRFQVRHGLKMDGVVGPATRAAMNIPVEQRIRQIQLNMERWRWLPRELGNRYIVVNSAAYNLAVIENDQILFTMWVVIGEEQRQTPVVSGNMHTIVFNPYWTVPIKLVFEDLIPAQLRDPKYLQRKKIRVMSSLARNIDVNPAKVDWGKYTHDTFPYVLRQDPGPENPLGRIKFLFSNTFEVYLHDTPKRLLFDKPKRAFSAGCIRIENPLQLATYLLAEQPDWDAQKISQSLHADQTLEVDLKRRIPVYLLYLTSWVGEDQTINFYDDVYGRDKFFK